MGFIDIISELYDVAPVGEDGFQPWLVRQGARISSPVGNIGKDDTKGKSFGAQKRAQNHERPFRAAG